VGEGGGWDDSMHGWGRWGPDDELGALNLLGPAEVLQGLAQVRDGTVLSLAAPIVSGRGFGIVGRPDPLHYMVRDGGDYAAGLAERAGFGFADDVVLLPTHGVTHVDALAHIWRDGQMYNGIPADAVTSQGASRLGVEKMRPLVTRGVFVDCAPGGYRDPGDRVHQGELARLLAASDVELQPGDALLVQTGWLPAFAAARADAASWPGLDGDCAAWLAERGVVLVGADNVGVEAHPSGDPGCQVPLHVELLRGHGVYLAELLDLEALAAAGRATFLFMLAPLPLAGAVGSPVAPVAVL
jgi:kynurenine formamidase